MSRTNRNSDANQQRKNRILGCTQCKGTPPLAECNLQGIQTTYCDLCMEVINYSNSSKPIITKEKISNKIVEEVKEKIASRNTINYQDLNLS